MAFDERTVTGTWDYTSLPDNVQLGTGCWLERRDSFARFRSERQPGLRLGDRVRVFTWTSFNIEPTGWVEIGDDSTLVGAIFMCAGHIRLGRQVTISYNVTLADSDFHPIDPQSRRQDAVANSPRGDRRERPRFDASPISIGDGVSIGIAAMVLKGVTIGDGAVVEAGAVVTHDVPAGATVAGNPARSIVPRSTAP